MGRVVSMFSAKWWRALLVLLPVLMASCAGQVGDEESIETIGQPLCTAATFTTSPDPPSGVGTVVTLTAGGTTCDMGENAIYRFRARQGSQPWIELRGFDTSPTYDWDTTGFAPGAWKLLVTVRSDSGGGKQNIYGDYSLGDGCSDVSAVASPDPPQPPGTSVQFTGSSTCAGSATPEYRYVYRLQGTTEWFEASDWAPGVATWDTTGLSAGNYNLVVYVRAAGTVGAEDQAWLSYQLGDICDSVGISTSPGSPQPSGTVVTLTGAASCVGAGTPEYRFLYRPNSVTTYTELRTWGAATYDWDTTGLADGGYNLRVEARAQGNTSGAESYATTPFTIGLPSGGSYTQVSTSQLYHTCARVSDGSVRCWGANDYGQLGRSGGASNVPLAVPGLSSVKEVAAGGYHSCALHTGGTVSCWGRNDAGQLGNGSNTDSTSPVSVSGISTATAIVAGTYHACALLGDGTVSCWGDSSTGQLGNGGNIDSNVPVAATGVSGVTELTAGGWHNCARSGGSVSCWGKNSNGQIGNGGGGHAFTAVAVSGLGSATSIAGGDEHTCAVVGGGVSCWGLNDYGELGDGSTTSASTPVSVSGLGGTAVAVAAGFPYSCALLSGGTIECWGDNSLGELGDGTGSSSLSPVAVSGVSSADSLSGGGLHACTLLDDSSLLCWGYNADGALGNGNNSDQLSPVPVGSP